VCLFGPSWYPLGRNANKARIVQMRDDQEIDKTAGDLRECFRTAGQEHVFTFWDHLDPPGRRQLVRQLEEVDLQILDDLPLPAEARTQEGVGELLPAPCLGLGDEPENGGRAAARRRGEELLAAGKIALLLVAGGRGSRLDWDGPKGCFPLAPLSGKSLFEIHAKKIRRLRQVHDTVIPWYIMTSSATDAQTRDYFEERKFFGLPPADILFMKQAPMPVIDRHGKLILQAPGRIILSPNGHGGCYSALRDSGALADASRREIEHIFYFQVDNPLVNIADPLFCGLHDLSRSDMSLKVLEKTGPGEKIGVVATRDGTPAVVEYSDLPVEKAEVESPDGGLLFSFGSIGIHLLRRDFIEELLSAPSPLPLHPVRKQVDGIDEKGRQVKIEAIQFETFVFDALALARSFLNLETRREREFAPVKNLVGIDSVESSRQLLMDEYRRWLSLAGITARGMLEIDPLAGISPSGLSGELKPWDGMVFDNPLLVSRGEDGELSLAEQPPQAELS